MKFSPFLRVFLILLIKQNMVIYLNQCISLKVLNTLGARHWSSAQAAQTGLGAARRISQYQHNKSHTIITSLFFCINFNNLVVIRHTNFIILSLLFRMQNHTREVLSLSQMKMKFGVLGRPMFIWGARHTKVLGCLGT